MMVVMMHNNEGQEAKVRSTWPGLSSWMFVNWFPGRLHFWMCELGRLTLTARQRAPTRTIKVGSM